MIIDRRTALLSALALPTFARPVFAETDNIRLGQATVSLSFVKIFAARALDSFAGQAASLEWTVIQGGDPPALAAVDSGDLDLAAVGSDTALSAAAKGQPFKIVYSLMSKFPYELTVSNTFLKKVGVTKEAPFAERVAVLKEAVVGASAIGGAQDRAVRWLAGKGGLDPKIVKVALVGGPPALGAALENGRIDAFMLSPPENVLAEARGYGTVLVRPSREIPSIAGIPSLVLVARTAPAPDVQARITKAIRAINVATTALLADPTAVADKIHTQFFPKIPQEIVRGSVRELMDGLGDNGRLDANSAKLLRQYATDLGNPAPASDDFWTNSYVEAAMKA